MIKSFIPVFFLILVTACGTKEKPTQDNFSTVPAPAKLTAGDGMMEWKGEVSIVADQAGEASAEFLSAFFKTKGITTSSTPGSQSINLSVVSDSTLGKEGYSLSVN